MRATTHDEAPEGAIALSLIQAVQEWPQLRAAPALDDLTLRCDLTGNPDEVAELTYAIAARGLPPGLARLHFDRSHHWEGSGNDELELDTEKAHLSLNLHDPMDADLMLAAFVAVLARRPALTAIELCFRAYGRNPIDPVLARIADAGPWPSLAALTLLCTRHNGREWIQWIASRTIDRLLASCPALTKLSLPRAELWLGAIAHPALRRLELGWLGHAPCGPADRRDWGPAPVPRGAGLEFLRTADLPALEELAIDFQFAWYVGWQPSDLAALCEAEGLPRLRRLELFYASDGDELLRRLVDAPWAPQLEALDLAGTEFDAETSARLVAARPRLARLDELVCFRPPDLDDAAWRALCSAYTVRIPD